MTTLPQSQLELSAVEFKPTLNPLPNMSFCDIGRTIQTSNDDQISPEKKGLLSIAFEKKDLGWVNAKTLRVFEFDPEKKSFQLVEGSWVDAEQRLVHAAIDRGGIYTLVGLPSRGPILKALQAFAKLTQGKVDSNAAWRHSVCEVILCIEPDFGPFPGGVKFSPCQLCLGLPTISLPEIQLIPVFPKPKPLPSTPTPRLPKLYVLTGQGDAANRFSSVDVIDIATKQIDMTIPLGPFEKIYPNGQHMDDVGLAVSSRGDIAVVDEFNHRIWFARGRSVSFLRVAFSPFSCIFSPDGSTLWVHSSAALQRIDMSTRAVTTVANFNSDNLPYSMAMSPNGAVITICTLRGSLLEFTTVNNAMRNVLPIPLQVFRLPATLLDDRTFAYHEVTTSGPFFNEIDLLNPGVLGTGTLGGPWALPNGYCTRLLRIADKGYWTHREAVANDFVLVANLASGQRRVTQKRAIASGYGGNGSPIAAHGTDLFIASSITPNIGRFDTLTSSFTPNHFVASQANIYDIFVA